MFFFFFNNFHIISNGGINIPRGIDLRVYKISTLFMQSSVKISLSIYRLHEQTKRRRIKPLEINSSRSPEEFDMHNPILTRLFSRVKSCYWMNKTFMLCVASCKDIKINKYKTYFYNISNFVVRLIYTIISLKKYN